MTADHTPMMQHYLYMDFLYKLKHMLKPLLLNFLGGYFPVVTPSYVSYDNLKCAALSPRQFSAIRRFPRVSGARRTSEQPATRF
jgi:hypothetical protein